MGQVIPVSAPHLGVPWGQWVRGAVVTGWCLAVVRVCTVGSQFPGAGARSHVGTAAEAANIMVDSVWMLRAVPDAVGTDICKVVAFLQTSWVTLWVRVLRG